MVPLQVNNNPSEVSVFIRPLHFSASPFVVGQPVNFTLGIWEGESMFTIQVKKPNKPDFQASDLLLFHGECGGGALKTETDNCPGWLLVCTRCNAVGRVETSAEGTSKICMTALDGKVRPIKRSSYGDREEFVAERID